MKKNNVFRRVILFFTLFSTLFLSPIGVKAQIDFERYPELIVLNGTEVAFQLKINASNITQIDVQVPSQGQGWVMEGFELRSGAYNGPVLVSRTEGGANGWTNRKDMGLGLYSFQKNVGSTPNGVWGIIYLRTVTGAIGASVSDRIIAVTVKAGAETKRQSALIVQPVEPVLLFTHPVAISDVLNVQNSRVFSIEQSMENAYCRNIWIEAKANPSKFVVSQVRVAKDFNNDGVADGPYETVTVDVLPYGYRYRIDSVALHNLGLVSSSDPQAAPFARLGYGEKLLIEETYKLTDCNPDGFVKYDGLYSYEPIPTYYPAHSFGPHYMATYISKQIPMADIQYLKEYTKYPSGGQPGLYVFKVDNVSANTDSYLNNMQLDFTFYNKNLHSGFFQIYDSYLCSNPADPAGSKQGSNATKLLNPIIDTANLYEFPSVAGVNPLPYGDHTYIVLEWDLNMDSLLANPCNQQYLYPYLHFEAVLKYTDNCGDLDFRALRGWGEVNATIQNLDDFDIFNQAKIVPKVFVIGDTITLLMKDVGGGGFASAPPLGTVPGQDLGPGKTAHQIEMMLPQCFTYTGKTVYVNTKLGQFTVPSNQITYNVAEHKLTIVNNFAVDSVIFEVPVSSSLPIPDPDSSVIKVRHIYNHDVYDDGQGMLSGEYACFDVPVNFFMQNIKHHASAFSVSSWLERTTLGYDGGESNPAQDYWKVMGN
ncbi:MAG: hypothetical protein LBL18_01850 [Bacteroidales bacterium]|nr:hypothetical protein [Bacteroidales bacterium]